MEIKCSQNLLATSSYAESSLANSIAIARRFKVYIAIQLVPSDCSNIAAGGQGSAAVEDPNVVEPQESALEDVHSVGVLAIDPPGEIEQQLVEDALQKFPVTLSVLLLVNLVNPPCCPGMNWRIHITECPFVRRTLSIGVHIPLAKHEYQLLFGK